MMKKERNKSYCIEMLKAYWQDNAELISSLPIITINEDCLEYPRQFAMILIELPEWAKDLGVEGKLFIPKHYALESDFHWGKVDWWGVIFWYLNCTAERLFEKSNGPIHSYSFHLKKWDSRIWQYAWVNRMALFLRRWAAYHLNINEEKFFGSLPRAQIILTHDVDAVKKTLAIRLKRSAFFLFNAVRSFIRGELKKGVDNIFSSIKFMITSNDYRCFGEILKLESLSGLKSHFNFYAKVSKKWSLRKWLFDPAYDVQDQKIINVINELMSQACTIGLHQSYAAWKSEGEMKKERLYLEQSIDAKVTSCRQHWLRFSWKETWLAQEAAGFELDTTLAFNDRPGFRNGAALLSQPWSDESNRVLNLKVLPTLFMDSHFYDYNQFSEENRLAQMSSWIDEVKAVGGTVAIIWHTHVFSDDYNWTGGYKFLLEKVALI